MRSVSVRVRGRVQGVGFRFATQREADRLGLQGWVRNLPDGTVHCRAQGPTQAVDRLLAWCRQGPPLARVDAVGVEEEQADPTLLNFEVR